MTTQDKALAFLEGQYAAASTRGGMGGGFCRMQGMHGPDGIGGMRQGRPDGGFPGGDGNFPGGDGQMPEDLPENGTEFASPEDMPAEMTTELNVEMNAEMEPAGDEMIVGTPDAVTTQSANSGTDASTYTSYEEMLAAYQADIDEILAGDVYGNNLVDLYNPLNYIGAEGTEDPVWTRIVMGASEGDMSMFSSLNLQLAMLSAGVDADIEWQWNGGHVPSEIFGNSLALYVDQMYGEYVEGAVQIEKEAAGSQTENGSAEEPTGTDISSWVDSEDMTNVSFSLADAVSYRTAGASKATPAFDVIDYGQEDYVFGSSEKDARHWDTYLLEILTEHADELSELFNQ